MAWQCTPGAQQSAHAGKIPRGSNLPLARGSTVVADNYVNTLYLYLGKYKCKQNTKYTYIWFSLLKAPNSSPSFSLLLLSFAVQCIELQWWCLPSENNDGTSRVDAKKLLLCSSDNDQDDKYDDDEDDDVVQWTQFSLPHNPGCPQALGRTCITQKYSGWSRLSWSTIGQRTDSHHHLRWFTFMNMDFRRTFEMNMDLGGKLWAA